MSQKCSQTRGVARSSPARGSSPPRSGQAFPEHSSAPIRRDLSADDAALGAHQSPIQVEEHGLVGPAIGLDCRAVVARPGRAIDQQAPAPYERMYPSAIGGPRYVSGRRFASADHGWRVAEANSQVTNKAFTLEPMLNVFCHCAPTGGERSGIDSLAGAVEFVWADFGVPRAAPQRGFPPGPGRRGP
jgi:hypothetical protein